MNSGYSNVIEYPGGLEDWFNDESDNSDDEGDTFFNESKYDLNNEYETIIINGIKYKHQLQEPNYILDDDDNKVGELIDGSVVWEQGHKDIHDEFLSESESELKVN